MEWYREQTIQLIDLFRARPALWDTSSVHYRNKRMKNDALEQISCKLKCPKEEIAKKICTLRVQFSRENVKVKRAREAGTVYNPKWFGYQLLCFLNDQSRYTASAPPAGNSGYPSSAAVPSAASGATQSIGQNVSIFYRHRETETHLASDVSTTIAWTTERLVCAVCRVSLTEKVRNARPVVRPLEPAVTSRG